VCVVKNERECGESRGSGYKADVRCRSPTKALSCASDACPPAKRETWTIGDESKNVFAMAPFVCWVEEIRRELNEAWRVNLELHTLAALYLFPILQILSKGDETKRDRAPDGTRASIRRPAAPSLASILLTRLPGRSCSQHGNLSRLVSTTFISNSYLVNSTKHLSFLFLGGE